jgi:transposase
LLTDAAGVPLALTISAANAHDLKAALPTVVDVPPVKGKRGRPRRRPDSLVADKAYDAQDFRALLQWLGIHPLIARRGDSSRGLGKARWPVERTFAWLHQFRRLRTRWDKRADVHQAFLHLAAAVICHRIHASGFCP